MKKNTNYFLAAIIFLYSILNITTIWWPFHENDLIEILVTSAKPLSLDFILTGQPHPPLWFFTLKLWNSVVPVSEIGTRLLVLVFGIFSIITLYKLAKLHTTTKKSLTITLLFATLPSFLRISHFVDKYTLFIFLVLLNLHLFYKPNTKKTHYYLSIFLLTLTHFYALPIIGLQILSNLANKNKQKIALLSLIIVIATVLPQLLLAINISPLEFPSHEFWQDNLVPKDHNPLYTEYQDSLPNLYSSAKPLTYFIFNYTFKNLGIVLLPLLLLFILQLPRALKKELKSPFTLTLEKNFLIILAFFICLTPFIIIRHYQIFYLVPLFIIITIKNAKKLLAPIAIITILLSTFTGTNTMETLESEIDTSHITALQYKQNKTSNLLIVTDGFQGLLWDYYTNLSVTKVDYYAYSSHTLIVNKTKSNQFYLIKPMEFKYNSETFFNNSTIKWTNKYCIQIHKRILRCNIQ